MEIEYRQLTELTYFLAPEGRIFIFLPPKTTTEAWSYPLFTNFSTDPRICFSDASTNVFLPLHGTFFPASCGYWHIGQLRSNQFTIYFFPCLWRTPIQFLRQYRVYSRFEWSSWNELGISSSRTCSM